MTEPITSPPAVHATELAKLTELKAHEQNYREHPADQRAHLIQSIREHGFYRNVIVANEGTILAGHGVVEAARHAGLTEIPVVRLKLGPDDPKALKILAGDNEIAHLAMIDDRALSSLLKDIRDTDDLLGTGYDDSMLTNLLYVTRSRNEIASRDDAAEWVGMPEYEMDPEKIQAIINFDTAEERDEFMTNAGFGRVHKHLGVVSAKWPPRPYEDRVSMRFTDDPERLDAA